MFSDLMYFISKHQIVSLQPGTALYCAKNIVVSLFVNLTPVPVLQDLLLPFDRIS